MTAVEQDSAVALLSEYSALREEIREFGRILSHIFIGTFGAAGLLLGYGFEKAEGLVFLSPFVFLIPAVFFMATYVKFTARAASYVKVFLEPELRLKWETRQSSLQTIDGFCDSALYSKAVTMYFALVSALCISLSFAYRTIRFEAQTAVVLLVLAVLVHGLNRLAEACSADVTDMYENAWRKMKARERRAQFDRHICSKEQPQEVTLRYRTRT